MNVTITGFNKVMIGVLKDILENSNINVVEESVSNLISSKTKDFVLFIDKDDVDVNKVKLKSSLVRSKKKIMIVTPDLLKDSSNVLLRIGRFFDIGTSLIKHSGILDKSIISEISAPFVETIKIKPSLKSLPKPKKNGQKCDTKEMS